MHWCVNINALQRPFYFDFFLLSWLLPSPEESCFLCKISFPAFFKAGGFPGRRCCLVADSNQKREEREDVEREWVEYDFTFQLPPGSLTLYVYKASYFCYTASCNPVTICIRCAIKPLYVSYLHLRVRRNTCLQSDPGDPVLKPFQRANWPGTRGDEEG